MFHALRAKKSKGQYGWYWYDGCFVCRLCGRAIILSISGTSMKDLEKRVRKKKHDVCGICDIY